GDQDERSSARDDLGFGLAPFDDPECEVEDVRTLFVERARSLAREMDEPRRQWREQSRAAPPRVRGTASVVPRRRARERLRREVRRRFEGFLFPCVCG